MSPTSIAEVKRALPAMVSILQSHVSSSLLYLKAAMKLLNSSTVAENNEIEESITCASIVCFYQWHYMHHNEHHQLTEMTRHSLMRHVVLWLPVSLFLQIHM